MSGWIITCPDQAGTLQRNKWEACSTDCAWHNVGILEILLFQFSCHFYYQFNAIFNKNKCDWNDFRALSLPGISVTACAEILNIKNKSQVQSCQVSTMASCLLHGYSWRDCICAHLLIVTKILSLPTFISYLFFVPMWSVFLHEPSYNCGSRLKQG